MWPFCPGATTLQGLEHLVRNASGQITTTGTHLTFDSEPDGKAAFTVSAENLAHLIALDEVGVRA
jgi:hypothetical protein